MNSFEIEELELDPVSITHWAGENERHINWPVVYTLSGQADKRDEIYVGESINGAVRLRQHFDLGKKAHLTSVRVIIDETFNKSVCLDLESFLIRLFSGDGKFAIVNRNDGITNADYFHKQEYRSTFDEIFERLREAGFFTRGIKEIENTDLYKLSPFKALTQEQSIAVEAILEGLFHDIEKNLESRSVIQGDPGTGKTVVAIYLMKLLTDIRNTVPGDAVDGDSIFGEFFAKGYPELLAGFRIGFVVPQQALRKSIEKTFAKTPGLDAGMVVSPFDVGESEERFDLLIVDEAHRLGQRANQTSAMRNKQYAAINEKLFGSDGPSHTQLDWISAQSRYQVYLLDSAQAVRPMDLSSDDLAALTVAARAEDRWYPLTSQMRIRVDQDYVGYVRSVLAQNQPDPEYFEGYDLRFFDDFREMVKAIKTREKQHSLSRLLAGYGWEWKSKKDKTAYDIEIDGIRLRWNKKVVDWVNSPGSIDEVGSIHTIQGYDLNFAGVIIGPEMKLDPDSGKVMLDKDSYFDAKGKQNNPSRVFGADDLLVFVRNIYAVLLTRGMLGTYVYVVDPPLREYLRPFFDQG